MTCILGREVIAVRICVMESRSDEDGSSDLGFEGTNLIWREARQTAVWSVAVSWGTFSTCLNESTMKSCSTKTRTRREHDRGPSRHALSNVLPPMSAVMAERFAA